MTAPGVQVPECPDATYKTLRDEIAIAAMIELMRRRTYSMPELTERAYVWADAMLKAREAK